MTDNLTYKIFNKATEYATKCHSETNHLYDGRPYRFHLDMVDDVIMQFIHLIPEEDRDYVRAGGRCHDVIEDCRQTFNDVLKATNERVAELAYALTNEKGKNRAERANDKYYEGIRNTKYAVFLKLADRCANIKHSKNSKSNMLKVYAKEHTQFVAKLGLGTGSRIWNILQTPLEDTDMSVRAFNCLKAARINSLEDLVQFTATDLGRFRNFGRKSIIEIDAILDEMGLRLGMDIAKERIEHIRHAESLSEMFDYMEQLLRNI